MNLLRLSSFIVGAFLTAILIFVAISRGGLWLGLALTGLLIYDIIAAVNKYPGDTLSEVIARLSVHPLIPWIFGGVSVWMIETKFLTDPYLLGTWFLLQGHFFFQMQSQSQSLAASDANKAAKEVGVSPIMAKAIEGELKK